VKGDAYAACSKSIPNVVLILFTRQRDGIDVVAKPVCEARAFWNVYSVGFGHWRARENRSSEMKSLIEENFKSASKECTSAPPRLQIDKADLDALLDDTDWVEPPAKRAPTSDQKKH
jgi:hypothetical protein